MNDIAYDSSRKCVVITCHAPMRDPRSKRQGLYQRFASLLNAASHASNNITVVAVYRSEHVASGSLQVTEEELEAYYHQFSEVQVRVIIVVCESTQNEVEGRIRLFLNGVADPYGVGSHDGKLPLREALTGLALGERDFVLVHRLDAFAYLLGVLSARCPVHLDLDDIEHRAAFRSLLLPPRYLGKLFEAGKVLGLARLERKAAQRCDTVFVCSDADRDYMRRKHDSTVFRVLENSVATKPDIGAPPTSHRILFVGALTYLPNRDGIRWFVQSIWPIVRHTLPSAKLDVIGELPPWVSRELDRQAANVHYHGFVDDIQTYYVDAQVVICPIRSGGGTRIKIIEACMYGRPVVSTSLGAEGLEFEHDHEIIIANTPTDFATQLLSLLGAPDRCESLAHAARKRAMNLYSRDSFVKKAAGILQAADIRNTHSHDENRF